MRTSSIDDPSKDGVKAHGDLDVLGEQESNYHHEIIIKNVPPCYQHLQWCRC